MGVLSAKLVFLISFLVRGFLEICAQGCMYCDKNQNCLVCDTLQKYYLNFNSCVSYENNNCQQIDQKGVCLVCESGYYYNTILQLCSQVPQNMAVAYCNQYSGQGQCSQCATNYYLNKNQCIAVVNKITGCQVYQTASQCLICLPNLILSYDKTKCTSPTTELANCFSYQSIFCQKCKPQYLFNENLYLQNLFDFSTSNKMTQISSLDQIIQD